MRHFAFQAIPASILTVQRSSHLSVTPLNDFKITVLLTFIRKISHIQKLTKFTEQNLKVNFKMNHSLAVIELKC